MNKKELTCENRKINYDSQRVQVGPPRFDEGLASLDKTVFNIDFNNLNFEDRYGLALATFGTLKEVESFCNKFNELNADLTLTEEPDIWILEAIA